MSFLLYVSFGSRSICLPCDMLNNNSNRSHFAPFAFSKIRLNSLRPGNPIRHQNGSSLIQLVACCMFSDKPLPETELPKSIIGNNHKMSTIYEALLKKQLLKMSSDKWWPFLKLDDWCSNIKKGKHIFCIYLINWSSKKLCHFMNLVEFFFYSNRKSNNQGLYRQSDFI